MIEGLYDVAISCDISPSLFWDYTLGEIRLLIRKHNEKSLINRKADILNSDFLASRIAEYVSSMMSKDISVSTIYERFPELFKDEMQQSKEQQQINNLELQKATMYEFVARNNSRRKECD